MLLFNQNLIKGFVDQLGVDKFNFDIVQLEQKDKLKDNINRAELTKLISNTYIYLEMLKYLADLSDTNINAWTNHRQDQLREMIMGDIINK